MINIYHSSGMHLGFVADNSIFSRSGRYLGWIEEDKTVWDKGGKYRGVLTDQNGNHYIFKNKFLLDPLPKIPRAVPATPVLPISPANVLSLALNYDQVDGFDITSSI